MLRLRQFIQSRSLSGLLPLAIAYSLAIQALMASIGLGMSAFAAPGPDGLVICGHALAGTPAPAGDHQNPARTPPCPFCFVAAQSAGHIPLLTEPPALPLHGGLPIASAADSIDDTGFIPQFRRTLGAPRAPPTFSV